MKIWAICGAMVLAVAGLAPAVAQSDLEEEMLRRIERLEQRVADLERGSRRAGGERSEVVAAVSLLCGADCGMAARNYCRRSGFDKGVAVTIEKRNSFDHVTRARCFN